ncbi:hypothetical protein EBB79_10555 [Parasedimentitalea marina]|uniref:Holin n=1 Tax=Parasedimentitalea marina TaxID=2483033 RepID=A0A3T0N2P0_9RHOB|nr:hypothetical protein [Parasedimentitalea marina]AZV78274.1 hypothetical protein EBB79_10555 [Parasedimentitalea marina]
MKWLTNEILGPLARRVGGQAGAALVALGVAQQHESAVAAVVAWAIVSVGELAVSSRGRKNLADTAKQAWGTN